LTIPNNICYKTFNNIIQYCFWVLSF